MAKSKIWTEENRGRALDWVEGKVAQPGLFRGQAAVAKAPLQRIRAAGLDLPEVLREEMTDAAWVAMLTALRQAALRQRKGVSS